MRGNQKERRPRREGNPKQERKSKPEKKKKEEKRKEGRKDRRKGTGTNVAQGAEPDVKGLGTALREVGFLLHRLFYA